MRPESTQWVSLGAPATSAEADALTTFRALLPDDAVTYAWSNVTFTDLQGRPNEVDVVLVTKVGFYLVELKGWHGTIAGTQQTWHRTKPNGQTEYVSNPWHLADSKAKRLSGLLKHYSSGQKVPYVGALVMLHGQDSKVQLDDVASTGLLALDGYKVQGLPWFSKFLLTPPEDSRRIIDGPQSTQLRQLFAKVGFVATPKNRYVGQYSLEKADPLNEGPSWQDLLAVHPDLKGVRRRIRVFDVPKGSSAEVRAEIEASAKREFTLTQGITHPGIVTPNDYVTTESGPALVFDFNPKAISLDSYLEDQRGALGIVERLALVREIAEVIRYAHNRRLTHRGLSPQQVEVVVRQNKPEISIRDWLTGQKSQSTTSVSSRPVTALSAGVDDVRGLVAQQSWVYLAPESHRGGDNLPPVPLDVYGLGALAYLILTGVAPAPNLKELQERLQSNGGLDPRVASPDLPDVLAQVVLDATQAVESDRTGSVDDFLAALEQAENEITRPDDEKLPPPLDPLDAIRGQIIGDRFEVTSRRGSGSTGTALEVIDHDFTREGVILKLSKDDSAAKRLESEAEILAPLDHPRIVRLIEGPIDVDGRTALLLSDAGTETLAARIAKEGRSTIEQLERYGLDLLEAVAYLDARGVFHRDIKPANLAIAPDPGTRKPRLTLFDLSLAREPLENIESGTAGYLDPFLGQSRRRQYDRAAELYSVGVTLFEMASGQLPWWEEGDSAPASPEDRVVLTPSQFEPTVAHSLVEFFAAALATKPAERFKDPVQMAEAWGAIFAALDKSGAEGGVGEVARDRVAADATLDTSLAEAGLSARALSGLARLHAGTVGELLGTSPMVVNSIPGLGDQYRKEIQSRIRGWRGRLLSQPGATTIPTSGAQGIENIVDSLLPRPSSKSADEIATLQLLLQVPTGDDSLEQWPPLDSIATLVTLDKSAVSDLLDTAARRWQKNHALDTATNALIEEVESEGRVVTLDEAAAALLQRFGSSVEGRYRLPRAVGLVRAIVEAELRRPEPRVIQRRIAGGSPRVLLALTPAAGDMSKGPSAEALLDLAQQYGALADATVEAADITPASTARLALRAIPDHEIHLDDERLLALSVGASTFAARSSLGELYPRDLDVIVALRLTLSGAGSRDVTESSLRRRVKLRFPALALLPSRPRLDGLIAQAVPGMRWEQDRFTIRESTGASSRTSLRSETIFAASPVSEVSRRLLSSLSAHSPVTLCARPARYEATARRLSVTYGVNIVDLADVMVSAVRFTAEKSRVVWDVVLKADAQDRHSRDFANLTALVAAAMAEPWANIVNDDRPLLLTNVAPLLRYGLGAQLAALFDLGTPRPAARWLLVPRRGPDIVPVLDGHPVPLGPDKWLDLPADLSELTKPTGAIA